MVKFTAYNRMYDKQGKQIGKMYVAGRGNSKEALERKVKKYNTGWNKHNKTDGYYATLATIKGHTKRKHHNVKSKESDPYSSFGSNEGYNNLFGSNRPSSRRKSSFGGLGMNEGYSKKSNYWF